MRSLAARINAHLGGRYYVDDVTAAANHAAAERLRLLARQNPTELYIVCPSTRMPVCMGEFSHRCGEVRPCAPCGGSHFLPYLNGDRARNVVALAQALSTFIDQAAMDVRDPEVAIGAARFLAHEAVRLRHAHAMDYSRYPGESERLYAELDA